MTTTAPRKRANPGCKIYRNHKCSASHRLYARMAKCIWPGAHWIQGEGPYVSISYCASGPYSRAITVQLFDTLQAAQAAKAGIDAGGCGGRCSRKHDIVYLKLPALSL